MLSDQVVQLVREIYAHERNSEILDKLRNNPEEILVALLERIKEDLPVSSSTLHTTVDMAPARTLESVKRRRAQEAAEVAEQPKRLLSRKELAGKK